jgi:hypothetical protein
MFNQNIDDRLSSWAQFRAQLDNSDQPLNEVWEFWKDAPFIPYNNKIDPFYQQSWPSPWEIIVHNKYDDFTKALMIGLTLKHTKTFKNSKLEIRSLVDNHNTAYYNVVCVDEEWVINYNDNGPILLKNLPDSFLIENLIELSTPR